MNKITDEQVSLVTEIANIILKKKHPDCSIEEWQVRASLEAEALRQVATVEYYKRVKK